MTKPDTSSQDSIQSYLPEKWRLLGFISAILCAMALAIVLMDMNVDGVRRMIRATARTSLLLFLLAFTAAAVWKHFPNPWTRWQRRNRRYLGLGFAVSHTIHAVGIAAYVVLYPDLFPVKLASAVLIPNYIAYAFIWLMALTSFDRTASWIGARAWKVLHIAGAYYLWASFMVGFGKRIPLSAWYAAPLPILVAALALRLWPPHRAKQVSTK